jgi:hypothetical protein
MYIVAKISEAKEISSANPKSVNETERMGLAIELSISQLYVREIL